MDSSIDPLSEKNEFARQKLENFYQRDLIEFNLIKSAFNATPFCLDKCDVLDENTNYHCFEYCIGKHTDSYDLGMKIFLQKLGENAKYKEQTGNKVYSQNTKPIYEY